MKQILLRVTISSITLLFTLSFASSVFANGNNWVVSQLRTDLAEIYNAKDYRIQIKAKTLPTSGDPQYTFTTGWLAVWLDASNDGFSQVGLIGYQNGLRWFAYSDTGINCLQGNPWFDGKGCRGDTNQWVALNQFQTVRIWRDDSQDIWIARIHDIAGGGYHDVASFTSNSTRIYRADADFEEGYVEGIDPQVAGQYEFLHPEYNSATAWKPWKPSAVLTPTHNSIFLNRSVWDIFEKPNFCDNRYTTAPYHAYSALPKIGGDDWHWQAGNGGSKCAWLFPSLTVDSPPSGAVSYTGSWTHHVGNTRVYSNTLSFSNVANSKANLASLPTTNSISRVYVMASNRGNNTTKVNGVTVVNNGSDFATTTHYQVVRTWPAVGNTTMEVTANGVGYSDSDAYVVDIPRVVGGNYDDRHYLVNYVGSWKNAYNIAYADKKTESYSNVIDDAATFTFQDTRVSLYYSTANNRGIAAVMIDGVTYVALDMYANSPNGTRTVWQSPVLSAGTHTIHVSVTGSKNASSSNTYVLVDTFQVTD